MKIKSEAGVEWDITGIITDERVASVTIHARDPRSYSHAYFTLGLTEAVEVADEIHEVVYRLKRLKGLRGRL